MLEFPPTRETHDPAPGRSPRQSTIPGVTTSSNISSNTGRQDLASFDELLAAHQPRVLRTAYRLLGRIEDAQDATQEVFLRLLKHLEHLQGEPQAWLYRVTVNICNDQFRRRRGTLSLVKDRETGESVDLPDPSPSAEEGLTLAERKRWLMEGLETLAERERSAVVLRDIEGLSTREVAAILEVEEVTIRSQISNARVKLARYVTARQRAKK
ncbi:MAG: sigma-70 family RNA polymerase sigma factor [Acidobacteriota bacterium]